MTVLWYPYSQGQEEMLLELLDEFNTHNEWGITVIAEYAGPTDTIYHELMQFKKRAGVNGSGGVHRLRHSAALQYLRGAKDSFLLQLFLRHESLEMSRRYTRGLKTEEAIEAHRNGASPVESLDLG